MFNSNVQPKVVKKEARKEPWVCPKDNAENAHYMSKCGICGERRGG